MLEVGARRSPAGLPRDRGGAARGARQAAPPVDRGHLADGHALGLQGSRRDHRRLSAGQPDHHRRAPGDGQERARLQHRRERRRRTQQARRAVLAGDGRGRARPALRRLAGADQGRGAAQGSRRRAALAEDPQGLAGARRGAAVGRRLQRRRHAGDPREGAAPAQPVRGRARADHHRLPAADAHRQPLRQPRDGRRRAEPRAEDPRARARRAGDRALAAQPRGRDAPGQETAAVRPARVREPRAGLRPGHVHLPRRVLRRGIGAPRRGRPDHRQASQRRRRQSHADLPEGVPEVHKLRRRALRS